ncbi:MAG: hypothetical protein O2794_02715 [bacterium]|nr:hypothetical protein [bacterium]
MPKMTDVKRQFKKPPPPPEKPPPPSPPPPEPESQKDLSANSYQKESAEPEKKSSISWEAPEYLDYIKTNDWYWSLLIITIALSVGGVLTKNFLFVVLVIVGGFSIAIYGSRKPKIVSISITGRGVQIRDRLFPFETLQSFWIFYRPGELKELSFRSEKTFAGNIRIPLGDTAPTEVRELLLEFLPEKAQEESLIDTISRYLKF